MWLSGRCRSRVFLKTSLMPKASVMQDSLLASSTMRGVHVQHRRAARGLKTGVTPFATSSHVIGVSCIASTASRNALFLLPAVACPRRRPVPGRR